MKILLSVLMMGLAVFAFGQSGMKSDIPAVVSQNFAKQFPKVENVQWSKEHGEFEANFEQDDQEMSATYDAQGNHLETETEMATDQLPQTIKSTIAKQFSGYDLREAAKIVKDEGTTYEAELHKGEKSFDVIFNADGTVVKNASENHEEKESAEENKSMEEDED